MAGTTIFYNGVLLQDCETLDFRQVVEYDRETGRDAMYSRFKITVASSVVSVASNNMAANQQHPSTVLVRLEAGDDNPDTDQRAVDRLAIVRAKLQAPRKDFWMAVQGDNPAANPTTHETPGSNNRIVLAATGEYSKDKNHNYDTPGGPYPKFIRSYGANQFTNAERVKHIDPDDGPRTLDVSVRFVGNSFMRVTATFEVCVNLCRSNETDPSPSAPPPARDARKVEGVFSNRWSVTESLDGEMKTTHTINGILRVKDHRYKAQSMRMFVHPLLFPYAKLESRSFAVDPIGHELTYSFVIREVGNAPPPGIIEWSGDYIESTGQGGGNSFGQVNLSVTGSIKRPGGMTQQQQKTMMLRVLFAMLRSRISGINEKWAGPLPGQESRFVHLVEASISENMKEPKLDLRARVRYTGPMTDFGLRLSNMGNAPIVVNGYDPRWWPIPDLWQWDTASENAVVATANGGGSYLEGYSQNPCDLWHSLPRMAKTDEFVTSEDYPFAPGTESAPSLGHANAGGAVRQNKAVPGYFSGVFTAYAVPSIGGAGLSEVYQLPTVTEDRYGLSADQFTQFAYVAWDSDVRYTGDSGFRHFPLSEARPDPDLWPPAVEPPPPPEDPEDPEGPDEPAEPPPPTVQQMQRSVAVRLHAGLTERTISGVAKRIGTWPVIPAPKLFKRDMDGYSETLLRYDVMPSTPTLEKGGTSLVYRIDFKYVYACSNDPLQDLSGVMSINPFSLRSGKDPRDKTLSPFNRVPVGVFFDTSGYLDDILTSPPPPPDPPADPPADPPE